MSVIHQIYCTHCTHGTSALERREGELAGRIFGYSARAGSLEAMGLRRYYRQIEPYVYYYLPRDTPGEQQLQLTAATAPRRMFFVPSTSGLQLLGQVVYRQTDTEGRPGSYFAHVMFQEERDARPRWNALDCLRLWGAGRWTQADSPSIPFLLDPLGSLDQMLDGRSAAIDDRVLVSFLTQPGDSPSFYDPAGLVSLRWRQMTPQSRCDWFMEAFASVMETSTARRESLLLVAEPDVAALIFYGIARLLPAGQIRNGLSFSTFEPHTERTGTTLAATWFSDPETNGRRPDAVHVRGVAVNTLLNLATLHRRSPGQFAPMIVHLLLDRGWQKVEEKLESLRAVGAARFEDLDALSALDQAATRLLAGGTVAEDPWRGSTMATDYLRRTLAARVAEMDDPAKHLPPVVGRPAHQTLLDLLASDPELPNTRRAIEFLLKKLPPTGIAEVLHGRHVSHENRLLVLAQYVTAHGQLPPGCDTLWQRGLREGDAAGPGRIIVLGDILARLDTKTLEQFYQSVRRQHGNAFLLALLEASGQKKSKRTALKQIVQTLDEPSLVSLFRTQGPAFFARYPDDEPTLGEKLRQVLYCMAERAEDFRDRLEMLAAGRRLLRGQAEQARLMAWEACRIAIQSIDRWQNPKPSFRGRWRTSRLVSAVFEMVEAAGLAMPPEEFSDNPNGGRKQEFLRQIAQEVLDGGRLLPSGVWQHDELWRRIGWYYERGWWPRGRLTRSGKLLKYPSSFGLIAAVVAGIALLVGVMTFALSRVSSSSKPIANDGPTVVFPARPNNASRNTKSGATKNPTPSPRPPQTPAQTSPENPRVGALPVVPFAEPGKLDQRPADPPASLGPRPGKQSKPDPRPRKPGPDAEPPVKEPAAALVEENRPEPNEDFVRWRTAAKEAAESASGQYFDRQPLVRGQWQVPLETLGRALAEGKGFIALGMLHVNGRDYEFRNVWENGRPAGKVEVPQLARDFGFASVSLKLQQREQRSYLLVVDTAPRLDGQGEEARTENKRRLDDFLAKCREVSVVLLPEAQRPESRPEDPGNADPSAPILGRFALDHKRYHDVRPPAIAEITVQLTGRGGAIPEWYKKYFVTGCLIETVKEGGRFLLIKMGNIEAIKTRPIDAGTRRFRVRFQFYVRQGDPNDPKARPPKIVAQSEWSDMETIEQNHQYTVRLELEKQAVGRLSELIETPELGPSLEPLRTTNRGRTQQADP